MFQKKTTFILFCLHEDSDANEKKIKAANWLLGNWENNR
jgi:hypothetical protein